MACEISQPKGGPCENGPWLRNNFAAPRSTLRNQALATKTPLGCEMISQPHALLCENFRSCEPTPWNMSAISQPPTSFCSCEMGCEIPKALKLQFLQPKPHFVGGFATAKPPFGTRVPFRSPHSLFRSCEMGCKMGCENAPLLQKCLSVAKSPLHCEN